MAEALWASLAPPRGWKRADIRLAVESFCDTASSSNTYALVVRLWDNVLFYNLRLAPYMKHNAEQFRTVANWKMGVASLVDRLGAILPSDLLEMVWEYWLVADDVPTLNTFTNGDFYSFHMNMQSLLH